jgi:hypothetical protein
MRSLPTSWRCVASVAVVAILVMGCSRTSTEVEDLRRAVKDSVTPYLIADADVQVKISQSILTKVVTKVASLPPDRRRITFTSNSRSGYVWSQGGGFAGCGGFAEIDKLNLAVDINELQGQWQPDGRLALRLGLAAQADGNVHGHIHGPAGPCSLLKPLPTCNCPIGGGFGDHRNVSASKGAVFDGYASFTPAANGGVDYAVYVTSPKDISVTVSVETFKIDKFEFPRLGIPLSFTLPSDPVAKGSGLGLISSSGTIKIADKEHPYLVEVSGVRLKADATGIDVRGRMAVKPARAAASK